MSGADNEEKPTFLMPMSGARLLQVITLGAVVGLTVWALTLFLDTYVFQALLCRGSQTSQCGSTLQYAGASASIIGAGIGLFFLVRIQIFRPLLVALASLCSLWGLASITEQVQWYVIGLSFVGLYLLTYTAYSWIARIRLFWLVVLLLIIMITAVRLILNG